MYIIITSGAAKIGFTLIKMQIKIVILSRPDAQQYFL